MSEAEKISIGEARERTEQIIFRYGAYILSNKLSPDGCREILIDHQGKLERIGYVARTGEVFLNYNYGVEFDVDLAFETNSLYDNLTEDRVRCLEITNQETIERLTSASENLVNKANEIDEMVSRLKRSRQ